MGNIATAFHKKTCPCFSEASYGRNPVEKYSMDVAMRFLLSHKDRLQPRDYEDIIDIFGEKEIEALKDNGAKIWRCGKVFLTRSGFPNCGRKFL